MKKLVYAHDGQSLYDELFLKSLKERFELYFVTFYSKPSYVPSGVKIFKMFDLIPKISLHPFEGIRMYGLSILRALTLKRLVSKIKPDAIIGCWAPSYGFYAAFSNFRPFILFVWGSDILVYPQKYAYLKIFIVSALKKADIVVVDSDVQKMAAIKLGCAEEKIVKFPWVDINEIMNYVKRTRRNETRKELKLNEDDMIIISLRNHEPIYGVNYLIDSIPQVIQQDQKVKFLILGEGQLTRELKEQVQTLKIEDYVTFLGALPRNEVIKYLKVANIYVSTSLSDGTSSSLLEAMTCSLPSVVTDIPGNREWIRDGWNGFFIPSKNSTLLAQKIIDLIKDNKLRREMGMNATKTVKMRVNWKKNIEKLNVKIMELINHKTGCV